ncbi:hypothetical protein VitviT2T_028361 [Vitis vinifera]|uniref:Uncharacterized protein n=1 Tax=Vitis vinifera TaxID=29760 RepID=A0ABY9DTR0_VITVI|nr:hypothetical protein VitviT2T_028361 [Vitis vinifera]
MGNGSWQCSYTISTASAIGSCHGLGSSGGQNSRKKEIDAASVDKIPRDQSGRDRIEGISTTADFLKPSLTVPSPYKKSDLSYLLWPSIQQFVCSKDSNELWFWCQSILEVAEKLCGSLLVHHPEALLMNTYSGNWKRAYMAL